MLGSALAQTEHQGRAKAGEAIIGARGLGGALVSSIDFTANKGEILGFAGLAGSGRDELLALVAGSKHRSGEVLLRGEALPEGDYRKAIECGLGLVPSDRAAQGGVLGMSVMENLTLTGLKPHLRWRLRISRNSERREVREWIQRLDIQPPKAEAPLAELSGGNQQKVVIAKWLRTEPSVLLLDEPTQGVDIGAKTVIHNLLRELAGDGMTVLIASSNEEELLHVCDRVLVLHSGAIVAHLDCDNATIDDIGRAQLRNGSGTAGR